MKRVMAGLVAGVVVICLLTSPLAAYDRDITLPTPNQSSPVWMYENDTGDDSGWSEPIDSPGGQISDGYWWISSKYGFGIQLLWRHIIIGSIKHVNSNTQIGNIGTIDNEESTENSGFTGK